MITVKRAADLQKGDTFSTDGYVVVSALALNDFTNRVSVELWLDASGGIRKHGVLDADDACPIWTADDGEPCQWFARCENEATHVEPHVVLGGVPCCDRCAKIGA